MNKQIKTILVLAFSLVMSATSCLNEVSDPNGGGNALPGNVESLDSQVAAMKISVGDLESVSGALVGVAETLDVDTLEAELESCSASVQDHIASVESGAQAIASTLKALELQAEIAQTVGALKAQVEMLEANGMTRVLTERIQTLEEGVASWLGDKFENYYLVASEHVKVRELGVIAEAQSLSVDALQSDVEAGLRVGDATEELVAVAQTVGNNSQALAKLSNEFSTLSSEVKEVYSDAIKSADSDSKSTLKSVNTKAAAALKSSTPTLADLASRISACETAIEDINNRLTQLEASVDELLSKIQSLTFMSDYSSDYAVAYYEMKNAKVSAPGKAYDGKNQRDAAGTIDLSFMIRPASAAAAVSAQTASVFGYYADKMQTSAVDPSNFVNFQVQSVSVTNAERGIVTVRISHDLKDDFYYKQTGAKCALSISTGKTDIISKFVELVPKDNSSTVYVEGIKINTDDFEIDEGQSKNLTATVNPSSATNKTVKWTSSNTEIATIDQYSGALTAVKQGNVTITATTNGIDEWGDNLAASVNVKVNPSIRLGGPLYVEEGKTAELSLDFPPAMNIESKVWLSSDATKATVENGIVTGVAHTYNQYTYQYNPITITCIVNGNITLTHEMSVVVPQPRQIKLNNYGDDVKSVTMKIDQTISLAGSILPDNVDASLFRMTYESDGGLGWINFDTGEIRTPGSIGGRYVYIKVKDKDKHTYMKTFVERTMIVNVEPYYVESITLPATMNLAPGATATLTPSFTSDVDGKQPTNTSLTWTSSNSSIVSVDSKTGEMTANAEGTVTITATTTSGATSDSSAKTATCTVTVKAPVAEVKVGDYYYSDGTWGSSANPSGKTVVGVIFSNANAVASDPRLLTDYPNCTNGLVLSTREYTSNYGNIRWDGYYNYATARWFADRNAAFSTSVVNGYALTKTYVDYISEYGSAYCTMFNTSTGVLATHSVSRPSKASEWYIPSYAEMVMMYEKKDVINSSLSKVSGTQLSNTSYWSSTLYDRHKNAGMGGTSNYHDADAFRFNMSTGTWDKSGNTASTPAPVRVVLAF